MFDWFRPTCPCDAEAKSWVEKRLHWCAYQFGLHILLERPVVLATPEFFPDPWDGSPRAARQMFRRVCSYMEVDPDDVELAVYTDRTPQGRIVMDPTAGFAAGTWQGTDQPWQKGVVRIEKSLLDRPADVVGVMAHELAHQRILGEGRADASAFDNELLTDLTAVYHGFGVFLANNPRKHTGQVSCWPGTKLYKPEYMSEPMLGYALAHIAWCRDEERPAWAKQLRWVPHGVYQQGLNYLTRTADSAFLPVRLRKPTRPPE
jgi:hypothetical protein